MNENSEGTLSIEDAVERIRTARAAVADDTGAVEAEADEETGESSTSEAVEAEAAGDDDDEDTGEADPEFEIETPEGPKRLSLSELRSGYLRQADYTRKTQETAAQRKAAETAMQDAAQLRERLSQALETWAVPTEPEPNWQELADKLSPQDFNKRLASWTARQKQKEQAAAEWRRLKEQQMAETLSAERERLFEAIPEWRDQARYAEGAKQIAAVAEHYGFAQEELAQLVDHRYVRVLRDAAAYRNLQNGKPEVAKKVAAASPALKPGAKPAKRDAQDVARREQRAKLRETGSINDAVAFLQARRGR